jgi:phosphatidate cytidylyltransferase
MKIDPELLLLAGIVIGSLAIATIAGWWLSRLTLTGPQREAVDDLNARTRAWWSMTAIFMVALGLGKLTSVLLFAMTSFLALREFITLTPTRPGDHRALFWAFFLVTPLQYLLLAVESYGLFIMVMPVYVFLILPVRIAAAGDTERYLERTAKIQWALMICVYSISHAPALLTLLQIPGYEGQYGKLLYWFILICELSDVLQYAFGKLLGQHPVAPTVSPGKTWEGLIGGVALTVAIGAALWWATPFNPWQAAGMSLTICLMGFGGGLVMSAIKRDSGVKDWGTTIRGHGGVLDRVDSLSFAAPVFFHLTRYYCT